MIFKQFRAKNLIISKKTQILAQVGIKMKKDNYGINAVLILNINRYNENG